MKAMSNETVRRLLLVPMAISNLALLSAAANVPPVVRPLFIASGMKEVLILGLMAVLVICFAVHCRFSDKPSLLRQWLKTAKSVRDSLDAPLLWWSKHDCLSLRGLLNGGVLISGRSGSGKTSSSGAALARAIVGHRSSGGSILAATGVCQGMWRDIFRKAGRPDDLLVFGPDHPLRFNFLDYVSTHEKHTRNITRFIMTLGESLRTNAGGGGDDGSYWESQFERMIYNAVEIVRQGTGRVTAPTLQQFILGYAPAPEFLSSDEFRKSFHCQVLSACYTGQKTTIEKHDREQAEAYWVAEIPSMAPKTRSSILAGVLQILHVFNSGIVRELVSAETTVSPDDILAGKWVLVDAPVCEQGDVGAFLCAGWKYILQRRILQRQAQASDPFCVIWADEAHLHINNHDATFAAQSRAHRGASVYLTQGLDGLLAALPGEAGRNQVMALLTNFHHKIVHALGSSQDAEYFSALIGAKPQTMTGGSMAPAENLYEDLFGGNSRFTSNFSTQILPEVQPGLLINGPRCGGAANKYQCDALIVRSGEPFRNGSNYLWTTFTQQ